MNRGVLSSNMAVISVHPLLWDTEQQIARCQAPRDGVPYLSPAHDIVCLHLINKGLICFYDLKARHLVYNL